MWKNRYADKKQHKKYLDAGVGVPKSFAEFQNMKYNNKKEFEDRQGFYKYISKYPNSSRFYYDLDTELKRRTLIRGTVLPPNKERAYVLPDIDDKKDPNHILKRMMERGLTDDELRKYHQDSIFQVSQWGGIREVYYTAEGICVIHNSSGGRVYKTAWRKEDFGDDVLGIIEVINNENRR